MSQTDTTDHAYKATVRDEWRMAAPGWERWFDTTEAAGAGRAITSALLEQVELRRGDRVLDVGAGYGEPGLSAAHLVGETGSVTCLDISGDMLAFAERRARASGLTNVTFIEADIEQHSLQARSFDAVVSRAALMYASDPLATLRTLSAALTPGGRLAVAVWATPDRVAFSLPVAVMVEMGLIEPPPPGPGVFALGGDGVLEDLVRAAGFVDLRSGTSRAVYSTPTAEACTQWFRDVAPPLAQLIARQATDVQEEVWKRVTAAWAVHQDDRGRIQLPCTAVWAAGSRDS